MEALFTARCERRNWKGLAGSVLLHGLGLLLALWYVAQHPTPPATALRVLPVEIVIGGGASPGNSAPAARLQIAPPRPQTATPVPEGTNPHGTKQPEDELSARLRALAQVQAPASALPNADNAAAPGGGGDGTGEGNYALKDFIRAQILRRWLPDLSIPGARDMPVRVRIRLLSSGVLADVALLDRQRMHDDATFRDMALSARDAALLASPLQLPPGHYQKSQVLTIILDPKAVLR